MRFPTVRKVYKMFNTLMKLIRMRPESENILNLNEKFKCNVNVK